MCLCVEVAKGHLAEAYENVLTGRQKGLYVLRTRRHGGRTVVWWRGGIFMGQWSGLTGGEETGRGAGGGAVGVIVSSSLASAANCLDECRAMAAGQQMNH